MKTSTEKESKNSEDKIEKKVEKEKEGVPEYVGPKFYGTDHPRDENETDNNSTHESLQELVEKNIKWSQVIYNQNKKIKRRLTMLVIGNYFRLFLIIAPIILGVLYFPEIMAKFNEYFGQYLGGATGPTDLLNNISSTYHIDPAQLQKLLQSSK